MNDETHDRFEHWTKDHQGNIKCHALIRYDSAIAFQMAGMIRIEYIQSPENTDDRGSVQLAITPNIARQLAEDLLQMADQILAAHSQSTQQH